MLTDIQIPKDSKIILDKVNNLKPDLVLIGGDMISGSPQYIDTAAKYVGKIKANTAFLAAGGIMTIGLTDLICKEVLRK